MPLAAFRTWIALHETTHAFEFEAHPWLRPYLADRLERQLAAFAGGTKDLPREMLRRLGRALRGEGGGEHWMERLMSDEQRRLFRETQAVMSLLEGFSDYIMDEVGRDLVPDVERISERFHARREQRKSGFERAIMRLTGMDMKLEQYKKGERFVAAIADRAAAGRRSSACGPARNRSRATARSRHPSAGSPGSWRPEMSAPKAAGPGSGPGRSPDGDRAQPDPVGPLPGTRPGADPGRRARRSARDRLDRRAGRRPAR